jgi:hypothetical protein
MKGILLFNFLQNARKNHVNSQILQIKSTKSKGIFEVTESLL